MNRRTLLGASTAALATLWSLTGRASTKVTVVYIAAWDCPPCIAWANTYGAEFKASPEYEKVSWVKINSPRIRAAYEDQYWPAELRKFRDQAKLKRGVPRWIVIKDGKLVFGGFGKKGDFPDWKSEVLPAIKRAVADR